MNLQQRVELFAALGNYLKKKPDSWLEARRKASAANPWFMETFIDLAVENIISRFLDGRLLNEWLKPYGDCQPADPKMVGVVMAGNIPMVGFHDLLCVILSGHRLMAKPSSKDDVLMRYITDTLIGMAPELTGSLTVSDNLKGCDAYIATGSNQSARYFDYYFSRYPHIIRRNKTSAAVLTGEENTEELNLLADDIHQYFGLGCRNVTKIFVPEGYNFVPLLDTFNRYVHLKDMHKYANNYDYQLSIILLNRQLYMTNGSTLLVENENLFSPIAVLHYQYYTDRKALVEELRVNPDLQCLVGRNLVPFGEAQKPSLGNYADGIDTMAFLTGLR